MEIRYEDECKMLAYLAKKQLNLEKNRIKDNFEDLKIEDVFCFLFEEIEELHLEMLQPTINFDKLTNELGDTAACLVGLIAWINKHRSA